MPEFFVATIAGLRIKINHTYPFIKKLCRDYLSVGSGFDFSVSVTPEEIEEEKKAAEFDATDGYAEATCIHRQIALNLPRYDAFLLHSATIECDGIGYAFAAQSGVGKSTHIGLWKKVFGDRVRIINGDKPIVRLHQDKFYAYGTPWLGKECLGVNDRCLLKSLCFIERGKENRIIPLSSSDASLRLFPQILLPEEPQTAGLMLDLLEKFVSGTNFYLLSCNISEEAAIVSHNGML